VVTYETKNYSDGTSAFGVAPLPELSPTQQKTAGVLADLSAELYRASKWPLYNSAHEGYGVLAEEVDELLEAAGLELVTAGVNRLWVHVKVNQKRRDVDAMRAEAIQVAAVAIRFVQMIDAGRARK
jgi:hypothetical protein